LKVLIDTNVVLDVLLARQPFAADAAEIFGLIEQSKVSGWLCATTLTTVDYLLGRTLSASSSKKAVRHLLELFEVAPVNRPVIEEALNSRITDFEDAVLEQSARLAGVDMIITRNTKDFRKSSVRALSPKELLSGLER
jgi:predicted nucleic acid-binding protein